jgi:hypothetical protein
MASTVAAAASLQQGPDPAVMEAINRGSVCVFLDVVLGGGTEDKSGGSPLGRIKLELFAKDVSKPGSWCLSTSICNPHAMSCAHFDSPSSRHPSSACTSPCNTVPQNM